MKAQSIQPMTAMENHIPLAIVTGASDELIGEIMIGIRIRSDGGNFVAGAMSMFRTQRVGRLLGGTPWRSAENLRGHNR